MAQHFARPIAALNRLKSVQGHEREVMLPAINQR